MKRKMVITGILLLFLVHAGIDCTRIVPDNVTRIIEEVGSEYAPDSRIAVYRVDASIENDSLTLAGEILSPDAKKTLLDKIKALDKYNINDRITLLPHPDIGAQNHGLIKLSTAQVRRSPEIESEMITQGLMGMRIRVLKYTGKGRKSWWRYCQLEDGYLGWIMRSSMVTGDENFIDTWNRKAKLIVSANYSNVWEGADEKSPVVSDLVFGNKIVNLGRMSGWYKVELPDGRTGYVDADDVIEEIEWLSQPPADANDVVETATPFMGIPYLWGGTSVKGFDCSGFTQNVFKFNRILLPRDANMQVHSGEEVPLDNGLDLLQPGDLLFWGPNADRITHVGIYIGDSEFIHADGMVHINSFDPENEKYSEYRRRTLRAARRVLQ